MEISSHLIATIKPKPGIDVSKCPAGFSARTNGQAISMEHPAEVRSFISYLAKLLKKPVVKH